MVEQRIRIDYSLLFATTWHCGSGLPRGLTDRAVVLDERGLPYIPGSTVKGILREHCERLCRSLLSLSVRLPFDDEGDLAALVGETWDPVETIFGSRVRPGRVAFDDCRLDIAASVTGGHGLVTTRTQVSLSRLSGRAAEQRLFASEVSAEGLELSGLIGGTLRGVPLAEVDSRYAPATDSLLLLLGALLLFDRVGGGRSAGQGALRTEVKQLAVDGEAVPVETVLGWYDADLVSALELAREL